MFKKFVYSALIGVLTLTSMFAFAAGVGDKIGEVVYTDIAGYINHYPIPTYAYDGGSVVVAEDLANYGFSVSYDESARRLVINPDRSVSTISGMDGVYRNATLINRRFADALSTDITVSLGDKIIPAYAINGYMTVKLEDLADESLGIEFNWDVSTRSAKLWIDWAGITDYANVPENPNNKLVLSSSSANAGDIRNAIIGEWSNNSYEYATGYTVSIYEDGSITSVGHRNSDVGTYTISGNTITANMKCRFYAGGEGQYTDVSDYVMTMTYDTNSHSLYQEKSSEYYGNLSDGYLTQIESYAPTNSAQAGVDQVTDTCYMAGFAQTAYFRSAPSDDINNIIGEIPYGAEVGYIAQYEYDSTYTRINYNGTVGYVRSEFLTIYKPVNSVSRVMYVSGVNSGIYLRSTPYEADNVIATIPVNNAVGYIDTINSEFTRVEYNGLYGYVRTQYLSDSRYITQEEAITIAMRAMNKTKREYITVYDYGDSYQVVYSEPIWVWDSLEYDAVSCFVDKATGYVHDMAG